MSGGPATDHNSAPDSSGPVHGVVAEGSTSGLADVETQQQIDHEGYKPALAAALGPSAWEDASQHGGIAVSLALHSSDTLPSQQASQHIDTGMCTNFVFP